MSIDRYDLDLQITEKITFVNVFKVLTHIRLLLKRKNENRQAILHINSFWKFPFYMVFLFPSELKVWSPRGMLHKEAMNRKRILKKLLWHLFRKSLSAVYDAVQPSLVSLFETLL